MKEWLEILRVFLSLLFLSVSSWYDYKTREVPDRVWVLFAPAGLALTSLQFFTDSLAGDEPFPVLWLLSFAVTAGISLALFYVGFFGGADSKALICLSIALPVYPSLTRSYSDVLRPFFPLAVLANAVLASSMLVLVIAGHNLLSLVQKKEGLFEGLEDEPAWRKILAFATGFKVDSEGLRDGDHYIPLECFSRGEDGGIVRRLRIFPRLEDDDPQKPDQSEGLYRELDGKIWVTPGLPFLIFVTAGFIAALLFGDFITWLVVRMIAAEAS